MRWTLSGGIEAVASSKSDGDMAGAGGAKSGVPGPERPGAGGAKSGVVAVAPPARAQLVNLPWTVLHQVHGARVVTVGSPGAGSGEAADAAVTTCPGAALAVLTADCAPVALASPEGVVGVTHAGWRGLLAGVIEATVAAMRALGAGQVQAVLGPCIHAECYGFGAADLEAVAARLGPAVRAVDRNGGPALDLPAGVAVAVERAGAELVADAGICTGCSDQHWSWRARGDRARQAMVACRR